MHAKSKQPSKPLFTHTIPRNPFSHTPFPSTYVITSATVITPVKYLDTEFQEQLTINKKTSEDLAPPHHLLTGNPQRQKCLQVPTPKPTPSPVTAPPTTITPPDAQTHSSIQHRAAPSSAKDDSNSNKWTT